MLTRLERAGPIRTRMQGLPRFVVTRGGEYCFLPGLKALRYLASLGDTDRTTLM